MIMIVFCYGYTAFAPFSVSDFFIFYTLLLVGKSTHILPHNTTEQN
jgi:amino acid transporter